MTSLDRPGFTATPVVETWEATVYEITGSRTAYLVVPRIAASGFAESMATGAIDTTISDYLATPDTGRTLNQHALMLQLGLYDRIADTEHLAAPERHPSTGRISAPHSRENKNQQQSSGTPRTITSPARTLRRPILVGAGVAVLAVAGIGIAVASQGDSGSSNTNSVAANNPSSAVADGVTLTAYYEGTMTVTPSNGSGSRATRIGVTCAGDTCHLLGWGGGDRQLQLTRNGMTLTGSLPELSASCDDPITGATTAQVTLGDGGQTMTMSWVNKQSRKVKCDKNSTQWSEGLTANFTGTLVNEPAPFGI